jgi:hypothetical protein
MGSLQSQRDPFERMVESLRVTAHINYDDMPDTDLLNKSIRTLVNEARICEYKNCLNNKVIGALHYCSDHKCLNCDNVKDTYSNYIYTSLHLRQRLDNSTDCKESLICARCWHIKKNS